MANYSLGTNQPKIVNSSILSTRRIYSLNGIWKCAAAKEDNKEIIPTSWGHIVHVPGLVDSASPTLDDYDYVFYYKEFTLGEDVADAVFLKIFKGCYGKKVWVNGTLVGEHHFNYTSAYLDIKPYLNASGETNELVIRLGTRGTQPAGYQTGNDYEKKEYIPGLYDNVEIHMSGNYHIHNIHTAPDIKNAQVRIVATIKNDSNLSANIDVNFRIYEANSKILSGNGIGSIFLNADAKGIVDVSIPVENCHLWTPEDPFIYQLQVSTENDQLKVPFGMRTFHFDPVTKKPMLNGKIYMLRGTNITMYRFFEDLERGFLPWDKEWARKIIKLFKSINMNCARYCIGFPPEIWYEVADEEGFLVQDEYPIWGWEEQATVECVTQEVTNWINERNNHPCVFLWDIQNETIDERTSEVIKNVRHLDIQNRPWDNGWSSKLSPTDTDEVHPYMFNANPYWKVEQLKDLGLNDPYKHPGNPVTLNEYGWNWINRDGSPTELSESLYNTQMSDATAEERRLFNAEIVAMKTEYWRANRFAIIQHFCGLGYSREGGQTSDNLLPGLSDPKLEPNFEKYMRNAFAPVGLMVYHYDSIEEAGQEVTVPVYVMNDQRESWSGEVTLKIVQGTTVFAETSHYFIEVPTGYREGYEFHITIPGPGNYQLIAEYTEDGETIQSIRKFTSMTSEELVQRFGFGYKKNVVASSFANQYPWESTVKEINMQPKNVNDGDERLTRWASNPTDTEWIEIDLGYVRNISKVKLVWHETEYAKKYKIQLTNTPGIYTDLIHQLDGKGGTEEIQVMGSGRYVRMQGIKRASDKGYSLWEFQVFGSN
jgi:hypothetical protein